LALVSRYHRFKSAPKKPLVARERAERDILMIEARYDHGALPPGIATVVRKLRRQIEAHRRED
jgi:hypothetical protein